MKVLRVAGFANGQDCSIAGQYLKLFDFDTVDGLGYGEFTLDRAEAMKFETAADALLFWRRQSRTVPTRPDGHPNRPLTCTTIEVRDD